MNKENLNKTNEEKEKLIADLHAQLEWYTKEASEEEFDSKAVESILYLLDIYEPMEENYTDVDEAWKHFAEKMKVQEQTAGNEQAKTEEEKSSPRRILSFVVYIQKRKVIVAAVLVILLLALAGTTQAEAIKEGGFFYWLRQDNEGRQMITVPENLEDVIDESAYKRYYEKSELPAWCKELLVIDDGGDAEAFLEWKYIDVMQMNNYNVVKSFYTNLLTQEEVVMGVISYVEKVTVSTEVFDGYSYVETIGDKSDSTYVYSKVEDNGTISYRICEFVGSSIRFMEGKELEVLKYFFEKNIKK